MVKSKEVRKTRKKMTPRGDGGLAVYITKEAKILGWDLNKPVELTVVREGKKGKVVIKQPED